MLEDTNVTYGQLCRRRVFNNKDYSTNTEIAMYKSILLPFTLYVSETQMVIRNRSLITPQKMVEKDTNNKL